MSITRYLIASILLVAITLSLCSAEVTKESCELLEGTVDLSEYDNVYFEGCTVSEDVTLDRIAANAQVSFIKSTISAKITLSNVGKGVTFRFYDCTATAQFLAGTVTLTAANILVANLDASAYDLLPATYTLAVDGTVVPSVQTIGSKLKAVGGAFTGKGFVHISGGTVTTGAGIATVTTVFDQTTVGALSPATNPAKAVTIFNKAILSTCNNAATGAAIFLFPESEVTAVTNEVCLSIGIEGIKVGTETIPSTEASATTLDYSEASQTDVVCAGGAAATDGCTCPYSGDVVQPYCTPVAAHSFEKPSTCTGSNSYDFCLADDSSSGEDGGNTTPTSFGGKSSFAAASALVALVAAATLAL